MFATSLHALKVLAIVLVGGVAIWLVATIFQGIAIRRRFLKMKAQGIPIAQPYSLLFGHLALMKTIKKDFPPDAHSGYINIKIVHNWKTYFPDAEECPPAIYLDMWPIMPEPFMFLISPDFCAKATQETPLPRHEIIKFAQAPLTDALDLVSMNQTMHKVWRNKLSPGFAPRNLRTQTPSLIDETVIYAERLKARAGPGGTLGDVFAMYEFTAPLTFDIIVKIAT
jgi:hypothetical protein